MKKLTLALVALMLLASPAMAQQSVPTPVEQVSPSPEPAETCEPKSAADAKKYLCVEGVWYSRSTPKPKPTPKWKGDALSESDCIADGNMNKPLWRAYCKAASLGKPGIRPGYWHHNGGTEYTFLPRNAYPEEVAFIKKTQSMPCHITSSTYGSRTIEIWYYGCEDGDDDGKGPGLLGRLYYTFVNGHYQGKTEL